MDKKIAIMIPVYTTSLTQNEVVSLAQVKKILKKYDIYFVIPYSIEISYRCNEIKEKRYPDAWFSSKRMYSKLMLNPQLYRDFSDYEYILVYQLDAFVFDDQLISFCNLGYDYIGAPWLDGVYFKTDQEENIWYVGNGGLSLRKVDSFIKWTLKADFKQYIDFINEDILISAWRGELLNIAPLEIALLFSFEMDCDSCIRLTKGKIPFGCHAWEKHGFDFWRPYIENAGYKLKEPIRISKVDDITKKMNMFCRRQYSYIQWKMMLPSLYFEKGKIYIWGTGLWGISLLHKLVEVKINVSGFIDNNIEQHGKKILSYEIFSIESILLLKKVVLVAVKKESVEIEKQLQKYGYRKGIDYTTVQYMIRKMEI